MMNQEQYKARLLEVNAQIVQIKSHADAEKRDLTEDESRQLDELFNEFEAVDAMLSRRPGRKTEPNPIRGDVVNLNQRRGVVRDNASPIVPTKDRSFAGMYGKIRASDLGGYQDSNEFVRAVHYNQHHPAMQIMAADMSEGIGVDGGFLVPSRLLASLFDGALEQEIIRPRALVYPIQGTNNIEVVGPNNQDRSTNLAGLAGHWMGEAEQATRQALKLRALSLKLNKLAIYARASTELTQDGQDFDLQLTSAMSSALAFDMDEAFIRGDGVLKPLGLLLSESRITVAKVTSSSPVQGAATIRYENIVAMWSRMHPSCHPSSVWIVHPETVPQLYSMVIPGTTAPAYLPAGAGLTSSPSPTLMGRPVLLTEHASPLGTEGDIILADLTQYAIGLRAEASLQRSIHESWLTDQVDYRLIVRVTGIPAWSTAITPRHGTNTLSWCVTLETR